MITHESIVTPQEAAVILERSVATVRRYIHKGILPADRKSERVILLDRKDVEKLRDSLQECPVCRGLSPNKT